MKVVSPTTGPLFVADVLRAGGMCNFYEAVSCIQQFVSQTQTPTPLLEEAINCQLQRSFLRTRCRSAYRFVYTHTHIMLGMQEYSFGHLRF